MKNYEYWSKNGAEWVDVYSERKQRMLYFHLQEIYLVSLLTKNAPLKVLEFGCGVGRHLKNLNQISGIEVYGFDQSETMVSGMSVWAKKDWVQERVIVGGSTGRLPYEDNSFDVVFTSEVLVHVSPEDLPNILSELMRVAKYQCFHLEPSEAYEVVDTEHHGCWNHDLVAQYRALGRCCEVLKLPYWSQAPYRVVLDNAREILDIDSVTVELMFSADGNIQPTIDWLSHLVEQQQVELGSQQTEMSRLRELEESLKRIRLQSEAAMMRVSEIESSLSYTLANRLSSLPGVKSPLALRAISILKSRLGVRDGGPNCSDLVAVNGVVVLEINDRSDRTIAVTHHLWRGMCNATKQLFPNRVLVDEAALVGPMSELVGILSEGSFDKIVLQGYIDGFEHLVKKLKSAIPNCRIYCIWHGTFVQLREPLVWRGFEIIRRLCLEGDIDKWGFVKPGMHKILANQGVSTAFVMNKITPNSKMPNSLLANSTRHLGLWVLGDLWYKPALEQIAAISSLENVVLHCAGVSPRALELAASLGVEIKISRAPIPVDEMSSVLANMHLNFYVTFNDCAPMLPLESFAVGTPCLVGPSCYYFDDYEYLRSRLVVRSADDALEISRLANIALEERNDIVKAFVDFYPEHNLRAESALSQFLDV